MPSLLLWSFSSRHGELQLTGFLVNIFVGFWKLVGYMADILPESGDRSNNVTEEGSDHTAKSTNATNSERDIFEPRNRMIGPSETI